MSGDKDRVSLTFPARADLIGLARLTLSVVCRRAPLALEAVADLKLALTEAAGAYVADHAGPGDGDSPGRVSFDFAAETGRLVIEVAGSKQREIGAEERDLSSAILEATVDEWSPGPDGVRLVKYLGRPGQ